MQEIRKIAKQRMKGFCRVCPVCDGRACAGEVPGMGGLGTGSTFKANLEALARWRLKMLALGDDVVMIGRPFSVAAVGGLKEGVLKYLQLIKTDLITAMVLTGTADLKAVDRRILRHS